MEERAQIICTGSPKSIGSVIVSSENRTADVEQARRQALLKEHRMHLATGLPPSSPGTLNPEVKPAGRRKVSTRESRSPSRTTTASTFFDSRPNSATTSDVGSESSDGNNEDAVGSRQRRVFDAEESDLTAENNTGGEPILRQGSDGMRHITKIFQDAAVANQRRHQFSESFRGNIEEDPADEPTIMPNGEVGTIPVTLNDGDTGGLFSTDVSPRDLDALSRLPSFRVRLDSPLVDTPLVDSFSHTPLVTAEAKEGLVKEVSPL